MNATLYIAKRLISSKLDKDSSSGPIIKVSIASIAIGIIVLILAVASGSGLEQKIKEKILIFNSPMQISHLDFYSQYDFPALKQNPKLEQTLENHPKLRAVHQAAYKSALLKNGEDVSGVVFKGYDSDLALNKLKDFITAGRLPDFEHEKGSQEVLISETLAKKMNYKLDEQIFLFVVDQERMKERVRPLKIVGLYEVGLSGFDELILFGDIKIVQKLNRWKEQEFAFLELETKSQQGLESLKEELRAELPFDLRIRDLRQLHPELIAWVDTFDNNIFILLIIIGIVASINMISTILISMLERSEMVGILKSIGMNNGKIRQVFLYYMLYLVAKGLLIGNAIGLLIYFLQTTFHIIPLDQKNYHVDYVPMNLPFSSFIFLNLGILTISFLILVLPSYFVKRIQPIQVLKFK
ncbi:MAG: ABC transporter permease [Flavobacteriales bacterium]